MLINLILRALPFRIREPLIIAVSLFFSGLALYWFVMVGGGPGAASVSRFSPSRPCGSTSCAASGDPAKPREKPCEALRRARSNPRPGQAGSHPAPVGGKAPGGATVAFFISSYLPVSTMIA
ncbi:hypothetical protein ACFZDJ_29090 [Streptomyces sp. NPDC007896]|uniref:hypothetical protein n=1 Tax=Streptomyces sp. NPDC007896 TaxID=3364784 RepID=UPI0036E562BF